LSFTIYSFTIEAKDHKKDPRSKLQIVKLVRLLTDRKLLKRSFKKQSS